MQKVCSPLPFLWMWMTFYACSFYDVTGQCSVCKQAKSLEAYVSGTVTLECTCDSNDGKRWKHGDEFLFLNENIQKKDFPGNASIILPYNLNIESVDFLHNGTYVCFCNFIAVKAYKLFVKELYITINGSKTTNGVRYFEMDKQYSIACHVNGTNSNDSLKMYINKQEITSNLSEDGESSFSADAVTQLLDENGNITCLFVSQLSEWKVHIHFLTYASPHLHLTLNGSTYKESNLFFQENNSLLVECNATKARPSAALTLLINNTTVATTTNSLPQRNKLLSTTLAKYVNLSEEHIKITCTANGKYGFNEKRVEINVSTYVSPTLKFTVNDEDVGNETTYHNNRDGLLLLSCYAYGARPCVNIDWKISGSSATPLQRLEPCVDVTDSSFNTTSTLKLRSVKGKMTITCVTVSMFAIPQKSYLIEVLTHGPKNESKGLIIVCSSVFLLIVMMCLVKKIRELLIEKPLTTTEQVRDATEEEMEDIKNDSSCLTRYQVTLLSRLPGEGTMRYWKAVSSSEVTGNERFVAKTVSEAAPLKELYNFRDIATEVIALAKHINVVNTIGIAVENVPYYIYQEYIEYGSLRDYMMRNYQQTRRSQICTSTTIGETHKEVERRLKLTGFALGVSEGMSFLALNNFCHPALTSRKVLLTQTLTCKIYDFLPERMSKDKLDYILQQVNAPLAWLPPETIFLRQYSVKADVWSLAVLLWEIYSLGDTPYAGMTCDEIEKEVRSGRCLFQPLWCPGGIFSVMLSAWDVLPEKRPTFEQFSNQVRGIKDCLIQEPECETDEAVTEEHSYFILNDSDNDYVAAQSVPKKSQ